MPDINPPRLAYTSRDYTQIRSDVEAFIRATNEDSYTDFFDANLGQLLVDLLAYVTDILSYGQDVTAQETFLLTARRLDSALRFARSVGFTPRSSTAASVVVVTTDLPANIVSLGGTIPEGSFITGANGLRYELVEQATIVPGSSQATLTLKEGQSFSETFTPTQQPNQQFTVQRGVVEEASWEVFVGDATDALNRWTQVGNVLFETSATQTYEVFFDGDGRLTIIFGNGTSGEIPGRTITVNYRITSGAAGNTAANTVQGSLQADVVGTSTTAALPVRNTDQAGTGGQDRESVADLRASVPAYIRTLDKVITIDDYERAVATQSGVALAFADNPLSSLNGNIVRIHVWDTEQFTFVSTSPGQGLTSVVAYQRYVQVPIARVFVVQQYLRTRTLATVHNVVIRPTVAQVDLDLGQIKYDTTNSAEDVHRAIVTAVLTLFQSSSGFLIRISDIYNVVNDLPGVIGFTIKSVVFEHLDFSDPSQTLTEQFRTDQDVAGAVGGPFLPLQDITIPAAIERKFYDDSFLYDNEILFDSEIDSSSVQAIVLRTLVFTLIAG